MNPLLQAALGSIIRALLIGWAGFLVKQGIWSQSAAETYVAAATLALLGLGWSLWEKYKSRVKFLTALGAPIGTTEAHVDETIKMGGGSRMLTILMACVMAAGLPACATINVTAEKLTRQSIQASEDNRCTIHPAPCLSVAQFKQANAILYNVSLAGLAFTKVERAHATTPADVQAFIDAVVSAQSDLIKAFPDGAAGSVLNTLAALEQKLRGYHL